MVHVTVEGMCLLLPPQRCGLDSSHGFWVWAIDVRRSLVTPSGPRRGRVDRGQGAGAGMSCRRLSLSKGSAIPPVVHSFQEFAFNLRFLIGLRV